MSPFTNTPLHEAIHEDDTDLIRSLLTGGADPNEPNGIGRPPLFCTSNRDVVVELLQHGADPNGSDLTGRSPLDATVTSEADVEKIELLMNAGANPNRIGHKGYSTFTYACLNGDIRVVAAMVKCGADVNRPDSQGRTPLQAASRRPDVQAMLREAGAKA